jgi:cell division protein FtsW (lipid II flippase)
LKVWQFSGLFLISLFQFLPVSKLSTTFIYFVMVFVMLWWSKFERKTAIIINTVTLSLVTIAGIIIWPSIASYQKVRFFAFLNPEQYSTNAGYQYLLIKKMFSSAGWFGQQADKEMFPGTSDSFTDFAFVSITYYFGWIMGIILVIILSLFVARMIMVSQKVKDSYGKLLIVGGVTIFAVQLIYNIGMSLGFLPLTAMSLPFISYGQTPTLLNAGIIGIVLSVYRRKDLTSSIPTT